MILILVDIIPKFRDWNLKTDQLQHIYVNEMHFRPELALVQIEDSRRSQVLGAVERNEHSSNRCNGMRSGLGSLSNRSSRHVVYPKEHEFIMITDSSLTNISINLLSTCVYSIK